MEAPIVKQDRSHLENTSSISSDTPGYRSEKDIGEHHNHAAYAEFPDIMDDSHDARIVRKVDFHVVPWLAMLYAWSLIDRTNMGNAQIEGMSQELVLGIQNRYSIALLVFFPTYFISELPATLLVRHVSPRYVITAIALAWGTTMIAMGFVKVWGALAGLRALLGLLEGGYFPICVFLLSSWYKRYELQKRITFFYMFGVLASGLSSILAYGLARIGPRGNYRPWSFIFFVEGAITVALAILAFFFIVEFPQSEKRRFLSPRDHARVLYRLEKDRDDLEHDPLTARKLGKYLLEWRAWVMAVMFMCCTVTSYALSYFLPTILRLRLGFSLVEAQCLAAPPYVFAILVAVTTAYFSDRLKLRAPFIILHSALCMIGLGVLYAPGVKPAGQYTAVFLVAAGTNANVPAVIGYMQNNIHTSSRRAVLSALQVGFGAIGGIFGSLVFRQQDAPIYRPGLAACLACNAFIIIWACIFSVYFRRENKKQESGHVIAGKPGFRFAI